MKYPISPLDFSRDFAGFAELSRAIYGEKAVTDWALYRWLFPGNVYAPPKTHFLHIARDGERVVASDGLLPVPLLIAGEKHLAAWSVKTMTHPDYQRQGIFRAITEYSLARGKELGIELVLGFANANSYPGYAKFGWRSLLERKAVLRPLDIQSGLARRLPPSLAKVGGGLYLAWDRLCQAALARKTGKIQTDILPQASPRAVTAIWAQAQHAYAVWVQRDYPYIDWRYNLRPGHDYKFVLARQGDAPLALLIFRETWRRTCLLVDYLGLPGSPALPALLLRTFQYCQAKGLRYVISSGGQSFDRELAAYGFRPLAAPLANNMLIVRPLVDLDLAPLAREANWFFSYGDSELDLDLPPLP